MSEYVQGGAEIIGILPAPVIATGMIDPLPLPPQGGSELAGVLPAPVTATGFVSILPSPVIGAGFIFTATAETLISDMAGDTLQFMDGTDMAFLG